MKILNKKEPILLFLGDIVAFLLSLWLMLFLRYGQAPSGAILADHLVPFSILFLVWVIVFFIAGLYEKRTVILKGKLPAIIFNAQLVNTILAVIFFYFIPYFGITPKTNLFIYLVISFIAILSWRVYGQSLFGIRKKQNALLIGSGDEMKELKDEVNGNASYNIKFISSVDADDIDGMDFQDEILNRIYTENVGVIVIDMLNEKVEPLLPHLYNLIFSKIRFIEMHKVYEDIFDRIPLSLVKYSWFLENVSISPHVTYDFLKRVMDIFLSLVLGIVSLILYPFIILAINMSDKGPIFFAQGRIGKNNKPVKIYKFRTMPAHNNHDGRASNEEPTKAGKFLRRSRLDEIPQLWNVFKGDVSLIGPRPEIPALVKLYEKEIPYYNVRHLIKPGLSGWAQLYQNKPPKFDVEYNETKTKLSYDLYYIKNRSFLLDIKIALKTIKALALRVGV